MTQQSTARELDPNMATPDAPEDGLAWFSPLDPPFQIAGFAWLEHESIYRRLPVEPSHPLPPAVDMLANSTAGGQIRFRTDSRRLMLRVTLAGPANMDHMPATGQCGFDCYLGEPGEQQYYSTVRYDHRLDTYEAPLLDVNTRENRHVTLNFPLYQGVREVLIGLDADSTVTEPAPYASNRKVVIYGTSITQGGCASRPGMAYPNILSRRFPLEFLNLGFSGNGRGEPEVAHVISEIDDPACFILDYDANVASVEDMGTTLAGFIPILRERHPDTPIVVLSRPTFPLEMTDEARRTAREERRRIMSAIVDSADDKVSFHTGTDLFGPNFGEFTVDGVHPTDLGFQRMADALTPILTKVL